MHCGTVGPVSIPLRKFRKQSMYSSARDTAVAFPSL